MVSRNWSELREASCSLGKSPRNNGRTHCGRMNLEHPRRSLRPHPQFGWALEMRTIKPIERLVPVSSTHYCAYTPGLSTWWSTTALKGELVSRWVSRLDAFSGYPVRT